MERNSAYEVILETTAVLDLYGIFDYINDVFKAPESAQRVFSSIKKQVLSLDVMPARHAVVRDDPYASLGVRLMPAENYNVFYIIDDAKREVRVIRILYNRREWQRLL
ncbi:MAG: type II toxin-antitoxin system RelE/ParE family toxin [Defluviitaleaceae bacterium]|nr:type II toxin-antitoxin system RelE/ParE family toxin [Defluviitaleaceae bacterium]